MAFKVSLPSMLKFKSFKTVTANVSFYLVAILAWNVNRHSLQQRNVLRNVLIVDHHIYIYIYMIYIYIYLLGQLERVYNAISDKKN